jgi:hypothetical protein
MSNVYAMFCGFSKDQQKTLLSLCYTAKCWQENRPLLRSNDFLAYSPSYFPEYLVEPNPTFMSIYTSKSRGNLELSSLGNSKLIHLGEFPFTTIGLVVGFEELLVDSSNVDALL